MSDVPQTALGYSQYRSDPAFRLHFPIEGTVVAVHFPEDDTNRSKRFVEYDVEPLIPDFGTIRNAPYVGDFSSLLDNEETLLRPAENYLTGKDDAVESDKVAGAVNTDGDRVLVQFINGTYYNPIITQVLPHGFLSQNDFLPARLKDKSEILAPGPQGSDGYQFGDGSDDHTAADLKAAPGTRWRHMVFNGTHVAIDANGDVLVNFKAHPDDDRGLQEGSVKKRIVIQNEGADFMRFEKDDDGINMRLVTRNISLLNSNDVYVEEIGNNVQVDKIGGNVTVTEVTGNVDTSVKGTEKHKSDGNFTVETAAQMLLQAATKLMADCGNVHLGGQNVTEQLVKGTTYRANETALMTQLTTAFTNISAGITALSAALAAYGASMTPATKLLLLPPGGVAVNGACLALSTAGAAGCATVISGCATALAGIGTFEGQAASHLSTICKTG